VNEVNMVAPTRATTLPADPAERKKCPVASGVLDYFPDALVAIARVSWEGNNQHNPGEPLHWARGKSMDQDDTLIRHFLERGKLDTDGQRHSAKLAWRALAMLQLEIEAEKASQCCTAAPRETRQCAECHEPGPHAVYLRYNDGSKNYFCSCWCRHIFCGNLGSSASDNVAGEDA
jgi:hypothetical protein